MHTARRGPLIGFAALIVALLAIYGGYIGHGFVKDDVVWVAENRVTSWAELRTVVMRSYGFYRPVVSVSFSVDRALYDLRPFGYGVTNFLLLIACAAAVVWLARGLRFSAGAAVLAASIWALNFHGINMAVLWLSGRTGLLVCLFAPLAAGALVRGWPLIAAVLALLAMLSKEEAVLLPLILSAWAWLDPRVPGSDAGRRLGWVARQTWAAWLALALYLVVRSQTGAFTPASSPWFYRFTFAPTHVFANVAQYFDRACTFAVLTVIVAAIVARRRPRLTDHVRRIVPLALVWIAGSYALTVFLPVRSSLYACLPSIGAALIATAAIETIWSAASPADMRRRLIPLAIVLPIGLLPVYWARNVRWVEIADLSAVMFAAVRETVAARDAAAARDGGVEKAPDFHLVFEDDRSTRVSLVDTFDTLLPDAVALAAGRRLPVWLEPPPNAWEGSALTRPSASATVVRFRCASGRCRPA